MTGMQRLSFDKPDETRPFEQDMGHLDMVNTDAGPVGLAVFQPGWQWSKHIAPIAGTESCQAAHFGYFLSGRMRVVMDDGQELEYGPGDICVIPPGHDAWVEGGEPAVILDWQGYVDYAKKS